MTCFTRYLRPIVIILLAAAILTPRMPFFVPEDANRDARVDLRDVVASMRSFASSADGEGDFSAGIGQIISVLRVTCGLKTVVNSDSTERTVAKKYRGEFPLAPLPTSVKVFRRDSLLRTIEERKINSNQIEPEVPPPRIAA